MIPTPEVDWLALSPALALLAGSGVALLGAVIVPRAWRKLLAAFSAFAGFVVAGVFAIADPRWLGSATDDERS